VSAVTRGRARSHRGRLEEPAGKSINVLILPPDSCLLTSDFTYDTRETVTWQIEWSAVLPLGLSLKLGGPSLLIGRLNLSPIQTIVAASLPGEVSIQLFTAQHGLLGKDVRTGKTVS
jgi:hypothetical protein